MNQRAVIAVARMVALVTIASFVILLALAIRQAIP